ncbi:14865_t:CDS:1 [Entrophospora sp. SA101]|nr:14865_t:CDS:1 [Entrophospora sp. SA101]
MIYHKLLLSIITLAMFLFCLVIKETESLPLKSPNQEDEIKCPQSIQSTKKYKGKPKQFLIILKSNNDTPLQRRGNSDNGKSVLNRHLKYMKKCWGNDIPSSLPEDVDQISTNSNDNKFTSFLSEQLVGYSAPYDPEFVKDQLVKSSEIEIIEPVLPVKASLLPNLLVQNNPNINLDRIDQRKLPLDKKFRFPASQGSGVNVYIVDTGINVKHQEIIGRARHGGSFCPNCPAIDDHGHGTHVAALVGGKTFGVARKSNLIAVKVLNSLGSGTTAGVLSGLTFVLNQHKSSSNKKTVVNMSLGGPLSQALNAAVEALTKAGIHVVVAAGNSNTDACSKSPSSVPSAITVGATDLVKVLGVITLDKVASFSNFGKCVDIFAPGVNIISADAKTNTGKAVFSGTSQAAPQVAGAVALSISKNGNTTPAIMAKRIIDLSTKDVIKLTTLLQPNTQNRLLFIPL